jgi:hypothetical protein
MGWMDGFMPFSVGGKSFDPGASGMWLTRFDQSKQAAVEVRLELLLRVLRRPDVERAVGDGP